MTKKKKTNGRLHGGRGNIKWMGKFTHHDKCWGSSSIAMGDPPLQYLDMPIESEW